MSIIIPAVIPMRDRHILRPEVIASLAGQSVPLAVMPITRDPGERDIGGANHQPQADNRNIIRKLIIGAYRGHYAYMQDCDVVLDRKTAVEEAVSMLDTDKKLGAVYFNLRQGLTPEQLESHYAITALMIRKQALNTIEFRSADILTCNCIYLAEDLKKNWNIRYLTYEPVGHTISSYCLENL